ncbi:MAG TPA: ABC transporter permease [Solirubrobacteraceae bacterium]|jgi:hypothetical protein|nr:ABC transporter permease [Solirubrobacteraceae bacterium]
MSATTYPTAPARTVRAATVRKTLKAEWTKLRTLPSTWRTAIAAVVVAVGWSVAVVAIQLSEWHAMSAQQRGVFDPTSTSLSGVMLAAVILGALGVRAVTGEYSTGMIRSTFTAIPARRLVLAAKAATVAAFVFPITLVCEAAGFALGQHLLASKHLQVALGDPGVLRAMLFGALAVSLVAVIGVGVAGIVRHTAGATTTLVLLVVGGLTLGQLLPAGWRQYVPGIAAQAAVTVHRSTGLLAPTAAIGVLAAYAAIALGAASIRVAHRDA